MSLTLPSCSFLCGIIREPQSAGGHCKCRSFKVRPALCLPRSSLRSSRQGGCRDVGCARAVGCEAVETDCAGEGGAAPGAIRSDERGAGGAMQRIGVNPEWLWCEVNAVDSIALQRSTASLVPRPCQVIQPHSAIDSLCSWPHPLSISVPRPVVSSRSMPGFGGECQGGASTIRGPHGTKATELAPLVLPTS